jgi:hypothetical protein
MPRAKAYPICKGTGYSERVGDGPHTLKCPKCAWTRVSQSTQTINGKSVRLYERVEIVPPHDPVKA